MKTQNIIIVILLIIIYRLKANKPCFLKNWICSNAERSEVKEYDITPKEKPESSFYGTKLSDLNNKYV